MLAYYSKNMLTYMTENCDSKLNPSMFLNGPLLPLYSKANKVLSR